MFKKSEANTYTILIKLEPILKVEPKHVSVGIPNILQRSKTRKPTIFMYLLIYLLIYFLIKETY
jgi:hypothetical protein